MTTSADSAPPLVLVLGGTSESRRLAALLTRGAAGPLRVVSSLAGRVARPVLPEGEVRIGGFGGVAGLTAYLREERVAAVVDATHPFAGVMSFHAAEAAAGAGVPLLALRRPSWRQGPGDRWYPVASLEEAAALLPSLGRRVFLTTGRSGLGAFADAAPGLWFLLRSVDPPVGPGPEECEVLLDRGPFTLEGEREVLRTYGVEVLVTKDSGGEATAPKLTAAREAGIPVVVVRRPPVPEEVPVVGTPEEAVAWLGGG
ncbi:cobalt-precorrin-6A reductase [Streptomyces albidoflavus]|uniref:cobalt-precorrin-6A reductase n=1 Tax=Streptomyces albidoflavus TaxID=1886 RepID=UPI001C47BC38|nr:cobalt-precorrin-6A reductase [Streptomyces albidoflavus]MBV7648052.1 cobalt-precorrin-6A reductase [Streptomyces albidoflavus]MBV7709511.1 cobalt-precorrin-6A reductase [Streptomyces albidoflavus]